MRRSLLGHVAGDQSKYVRQIRLLHDELISELGGLAASEGERMRLDAVCSFRKFPY